MAYNKYSGKVKYDPVSKNIVTYNQSVKEYFIKKYNQNSLIDIGSGKGKDLAFWKKTNLKFVIGLEPSLDSMKIAIKILNKSNNDNKADKQKSSLRVTYFNATGDKKWSDGSAILNSKYKENFTKGSANDKGSFIQIIKKTKVDSINMFFTIHYMMTTKESFLQLFDNIQTHLNPKGKLVILIMNGRKIHNLLKKNKGELTITNDSKIENEKSNEKKIVFQCKAKYDYTQKALPVFGTTISVYFSSVAGLQNTIDENLVIPKYLIRFFEKNNFKLLENISLSKVFPQKYNTFAEYEKNVIDLYKALIFEKK